MMRSCEDWVCARGIPKIQLMVRSGNAAAVSLCERLGYVDGEVSVLGRCLDADAP